MVQRKFLNFAGFKLYIHHLQHDYTLIFDMLSMETLTKRKYSLGIKYLIDLLSEKVDYLHLLSVVLV